MYKYQLLQASCEHNRHNRVLQRGTELLKSILGRVAGRRVPGAKNARERTQQRARSRDYGKITVKTMVKNFFLGLLLTRCMVCNIYCFGAGQIGNSF